MNEFRIIGEVIGVVPMTFASGKTKIDFTLKYYITSRKFTFLRCESWNQSIVQGLSNGMVIELTNYVPQTQSWTTSNGQKAYKQVVDVKNFAIVQQHSHQPVVDVVKEVSNVPKQQFNPYIFDEQPQQNQEQLDWMNELDEIEDNNIVDVNKIYNDKVENEQPKQEDLPSAEEVYKKQVENKEMTLPYTYEDLIKLNQPYNHPTIVKPTILAKSDGGITTTEKIKAEDFE